jgi:hypothetical protein
MSDEPSDDHPDLEHFEALTRRLKDARAQMRRLVEEAERLVAEARERRLRKRDANSS